MLASTALSVQAQTKRTYTVRAGDTLYRIAVNHDMTVEELQQLNGIEGTLIKVGQVLRLTVPEDAAPAAAEAAVAATDSVRAEPPEVAAPPPAETQTAAVPPPDDTPSVIRAVMDTTGAVTAGTYAVRRGETLFDVAFMLGISVDTLRALNPDRETVLAGGEAIRVPGRFASATYTVRPGDTLSGIARTHNVSVAALRSANPGVETTIRIGQSLRIPSSAAPPRMALPAVVAEGTASVYPEQFEGRLMASGRAYEASENVLAHPALPFGTVVLVEHAGTGASTLAEVADRMPVTTGYVVEISRAVADAIGLEEQGAVRLRIIDGPDQ